MEKGGEGRDGEGRGESTSMSIERDVPTYAHSGFNCCLVYG